MVSKRTGLSSHLIRAWERRYGAVSPGRSGSNRRRYSEDEIERLRLLGVLTQAGHRIGDIARLPTDVLRERAAESAASPVEQAAAPEGFRADNAIGAAIDAVTRMDSRLLTSILRQSALALGQRGFLLRFVSPLSHQIGELWASGTLTAAHEHFASVELRNFLLGASHEFLESARAPLLISTTPAGQLHELGAAIVAAAAREAGWRVVYLGPNLPAADIAHAAKLNRAKLVALSIVYPSDDPALAGELSQLRRLVPDEIEIIAGGVAASANSHALRDAGIDLMDDLESFTSHLAELRTPADR